MSVLGGLGNGIGFMTRCSSVRSSRLLAGGIGKAPDEHVHLFSLCGINSHSYWADNTAWRCVMCGALVPRDGELHGQAKDGAPSAPTPRSCNGQDRPCDMHC